MTSAGILADDAEQPICNKVRLCMFNFNTQRGGLVGNGALRPPHSLSWVSIGWGGGMWSGRGWACGLRPG